MAEWSEQLWPSIKEGRKPEPSFIHLFVANTWSRKHHRWHIKRPAAMLDRPATLPGVDRALHQQRHCRSHHSNGWPQLHHATPALALPAAYTMNAGPAVERTNISCFTATLLLKAQTMAYLPTLYDWRLNKYYICWYRGFHFTTSHSTPYTIKLSVHQVSRWSES
jgi:hypothetical protein